MTEGGSTQGAEYTERLSSLQNAWWKKLLPVQAPYRWNARRVHGGGQVLDIGCGLGRNLEHLGGQGVGVDHNTDFVRTCRAKGLRAYTPEEFFDSPDGTSTYDSILLAHVVEHLSAQVVDELLATYLPSLRTGGLVHFVTPMERGYRFDPTHVRFVDFDELRQTASRHGLDVDRQWSFPFPRWSGELFVYNEFNLTARKTTAGTTTADKA